MKKRFIEWDLPLAEISRESAKEKNVRHGHPSTLHIWWARRPLTSSRAINFSALLDLPDSIEKRKEIFNLIRNFSSWEAVKESDNKDIKKAKELLKRQWADDPPKVLDPFAGGGSIPLESQRLGCKTYFNDYNPVAVFIEKATIEWPQKYGKMIPHPDNTIGIDGDPIKINFLTYMVKKWSKIILDEAKKELERFYPMDDDGSIPVGYMWTRTITCQNPNCGAELPVIRQFWLAKKKDKKIAYKPIVDKNLKKIGFEIIEDNFGDFDPNDRTISRGDAKCLVCGQITKSHLTRKLASSGNMKERMTVVVLLNKNKPGKKYRIATEKDIKIFEDAEKALEEKINEWPWLENPLPLEPIYQDPACLWVVLYGFNTWDRLFNSRQKLSLITFLEKIKISYEKIKKECTELNLEKYGIDADEAPKIIAGYLGIMLDRLVDFGSTLCVLNSTGGRGVVHTFGRQALPMTWDYIETNFFNPEGASWYAAINQTLKVLESGLYYGGEPVVYTQQSATNLPYPDNTFDAIFTDPPYYDNVPYSYLSDFFYVWLKRSVGDLFPDLFATPTTPKNDEIIADKFSTGKTSDFFEKMLSDSFKEIYRLLKPDGIASIVYAHKTTTGWETMLNSLVSAGLVVTGSWPIHTEKKGRLREISSAALASSIYMVCRKIERKKVGFYSEIQPKIKERIEEKLQQFWNDGIAGGDFFISAIGPGMEIFSRYDKVEKLSGEKVSTSEFLDYIRSVSTDFICRKLLKDATSTKIDKESEFYLAFRWTYLNNTVDYDDARMLASASGVNLEKLWGPSGFIKKTGSKITVLGPKTREKIESSQNMVDVMHKSLIYWENGERDKISKLLADTGFGKDPAFKQFCQAVAESLINGNKEKQLLEGFLIGIDAYTRGKAKAPKDQTDLKQFGGS